MDSNALLIRTTQGGIFAVRVLLVAAVLLSGTWVGYAVAMLGAIALATTCMAWSEGRVDMTWRGSFVGTSYLAICLMVPAPLSWTWGGPFFAFFALQLASKWTLGRRCTVTGPVFVDVVRGWPYNRIRHPMTAAELGIAASILCGAPTWANLLAFSFVVVVSVLGINAEEGFLVREKTYRDYMSTVPWRLARGIW